MKSKAWDFENVRIFVRWKNLEIMGWVQVRVFMKWNDNQKDN